MQRRYLKWMFLGLGGLLVVLWILPAFRGLHARFQVKAQHEWIQKTMLELSQVTPPVGIQDTNAEDVWWNIRRQNTNADTTWWHPGFLLFSNGWAAYCLHTVHDDTAVGDTSVLRTSDGDCYLSGYHFCMGMMLREAPPQPANIQDFLAQYGQSQDWTLLATKANHPWCVISCPEGKSMRTHRKPLWVWITTGTDTNRIMLFEKRYKIAGSYMSWSINWHSNECCVVDVYDYGQDRSPREYPESLRSNHLTSFTFRLDKQTGKFTD